MVMANQAAGQIRSQTMQMEPDIPFAVGVGVPDDPSEKSDLDGPIFPHTELPPDGGWDVEDAVPYNS